MIGPGKSHIIRAHTNLADEAKQTDFGISNRCPFDLQSGDLSAVIAAKIESVVIGFIHF